MKPASITTIILLSIWVSTPTLYAEPSSREKGDGAQLQDTITSLTQQASRIRNEMQNAEDTLQAFSGEDPIDRKEWLQAYSERIVQLKKGYVEMVESDYTAKRKPQDTDDLETMKNLIDHLQAQRAELLRKEREYLKLERDVERLENLYALLLNRLKEMDIPAANRVAGTDRE